MMMLLYHDDGHDDDDGSFVMGRVILSAVVFFSLFSLCV